MLDDPGLALVVLYEVEILWLLSYIVLQYICVLRLKIGLYALDILESESDVLAECVVVCDLDFDLVDGVVLGLESVIYDEGQLGEVLDAEFRELG